MSVLTKKLFAERRQLKELKINNEREILFLRNLLKKKEKYDWTLPILEENNRLKEQLALAMHDNERLISELGTYQHICKHFTKQ